MNEAIVALLSRSSLWVPNIDQNIYCGYFLSRWCLQVYPFSKLCEFSTSTSYSLPSFICGNNLDFLPKTHMPLWTSTYSTSSFDWISLFHLVGQHDGRSIISLGFSVCFLHGQKYFSDRQIWWSIYLFSWIFSVRQLNKTHLGSLDITSWGQSAKWMLFESALQHTWQSKKTLKAVPKENHPEYSQRTKSIPFLPPDGSYPQVGKDRKGRREGVRQRMRGRSSTRMTWVLLNLRWGSVTRRSLSGVVSLSTWLNTTKE